jgi:ubiquinone/menaquinone biosynthesis C-methylase UbiE
VKQAGGFELSQPGTYIHGTEPGEQERLAGLNRLTNRSFVEFLRVRPATRVLEVGSGLGILAAELASTAAGVRVVGLEQSPEQVAAAVAHPGVRYVQGDAHSLEFTDGGFDLVFARYLLEHVSDPARVLGEMRRVARRGGRVAACENDVTLLRLDPPCPVFEKVWEAFQQRQRDLGGDSQIGRRLYRLFRSAGFSAIELSVQPEVHWHGSVGFGGWIRNIIGNIESARRGLVESGLCHQAQVDDAIAELASLVLNDDASSHFVWNRAMAVR